MSIEIINYLIDTHAFEVGVEREITPEIRQGLLKKLQINKVDLGIRLNNTEVFKYTSRKSQSNNERVNRYFLTINVCPKGPFELEDTKQTDIEELSYLNITVQLHKETGFINATKLCLDGNKNLFNWMKNDSSKSMVSFYESRLGEVKKEILNVPNEFKGTYVHKDLAIHIACWVSNEFAFNVSKVVNDYIFKEKDDKIAELIKLTKEQNLKLDALHQDNMVTHDKLNRVTDDINTIKINTVPSDGFNVFLIYHIKDKCYKCIRCLAKDEKKKVDKNCRLVYRTAVPNSVEFWSAFREEHKTKRDISCSYNDFSLMTIDESDLIDSLKEHRERIDEQLTNI